MKKLNGKITNFINRIVNCIFSSKILIVILMLPFFKTSGYLAIPFLSEVMNALLIVECAFFLFVRYRTNRASPLLVLVSAYCLWTYFICPLFNPTGTSPSFYYLILFLGAISFFETALSTNCKNSLDAISTSFVIMVVLNYMLMSLFKEGIVPDAGDKIFLLGLRTAFPIVIFPGMLFCCLYDNLYSQKNYSFRSLLLICIGMISLIEQWVVTGIIQFVLIVAMFLALKLNIFKKIANIQTFFLLLIGFNFVIVIFGFDNIIFKSIFSLLNREITLTGRTYIWELVMEKMAVSPLLGHGADSLVDVHGVMKPAHSQWLHVAIESGWIGLLFILMGLFISCNKLLQYRDKSFYYIVSVFILGILISCFVEIQTYMPFIFLAFEIPYMADCFYKDKKIEEEKNHGCVV